MGFVIGMWNEKEFPFVNRKFLSRKERSFYYVQ